MGASLALPHLTLALGLSCSSRDGKRKKVSILFSKDFLVSVDLAPRGKGYNISVPFPLKNNIGQSEIAL